MGEPALQHYDSDDEQPVVRPNLRSLEGGGESTPRSSGHLSAVGKESPKTINPAVAEAAAVPSPAPTKAATDEQSKVSDTLGKGFSPEEKGKRKTRLSGRQKAIAGSAAGLGIGAILGFFSIFSGPLEFIHMAQVLSSFHFSSQEDQSDIRTTNLIRFALNPGHPERLRMSMLANHYADKFEVKLNAAGFKSTYKSGLGYGTGYEINRQGESFKGLDDKAVKAKLTGEMGISDNLISGSGDHIQINMSATGDSYKTFSGLSRGLMNEAGYGKKIGWIGSRMLGKRAGSASIFHPIQRIDDKIIGGVDQKIIEWRKSRVTQVSDGAPITGPDGIARDSKGDPISSADGDATKAAADEVVKEATAASEDAKSGKPGAIEGFKGSLGGKVALGGAGAVGVACLLKSVADKAGALKQTQVVLPLIRVGMSVLGIAGEMMDGSGDVDLDQVGYYSDLMDGVDSSGKQSSWQDAQSIQAEFGSDGGVVPSETLTSIGKGTPFGFLSAGAIGTAVGAACSTVGQFTILALSFATGPIGTLVQGTIGYFAAPKAIDLAARWLSGSPVDPLAVGADYGNNANYGTLLAANDNALGRGGVALSSTQAAAIKSSSSELDQEEFNSRSFAYRMFNVDDQKSLASHIIDKQNPNVTQNVSQMASGVFNVTHTFGSIFNNFLGGAKVHAAATPYDYGFPVYGFSDTDMQDPSVADPYVNAGHARDALEGSGGSDLIAKAKRCFNVDIKLDTDGNWAVDGKTDAVAAYDDTYAGQGCSDSSPVWRTIRFFIFDSETMDSLTCYEGDTQSCDNVGATGSTDSSAGGGTSFVIGTYNQPGGATDKSDWEHGVQAIVSNQMDVVGTQETNQAKYKYYRTALSNANYGIFPDLSDDSNGYRELCSSNFAIVYNKARFSLTKSDFVSFPQYSEAGGGCGNGEQTTDNQANAPVIWLQDTQTGQTIIVMNTHNIANVVKSRGDDPSKRRYLAAQVYVQEITKLKNDNPGVPIFFTGDFNEGYGVRTDNNETYQHDVNNLLFCMFAKNGLMKSANGPAMTCNNGGVGDVDYIYTSPEVQVDWQKELKRGKTDHDPDSYSDHDLVYAHVSVNGGGTSGSDIPSGAGAMCYTVTKMKGTSIQGKMLHWSSGIAINSYAKENSPAGINYAAAHGYDSIDLDIQVTKDNVPVATHWGQPMKQEDFYDPLGKLPKDTRVSEMTLAEVTRLRNRDGQSQIYTLDYMIKLLAAKKVNLSLEVKTSRLVKLYPQITAELNAAGVKAYIKGNADLYNAALTTARGYGYWTRGTLGSQDWKAPTACQ